MAFEWTENAENELINLVEPKESLWDNRLSSYYKSELNNIHWQDIGNVLGCTGMEANRKFTHMCHQYIRYRENQKRKRRDGSGRIRPRNFLMERMHFLDCFRKGMTIWSIGVNQPQGSSELSATSPEEMLLTPNETNKPSQVAQNSDNQQHKETNSVSLSAEGITSLSTQIVQHLSKESSDVLQTIKDAVSRIGNESDNQVNNSDQTFLKFIGQAMAEMDNDRKQKFKRQILEVYLDITK